MTLSQALNKAKKGLSPKGFRGGLESEILLGFVLQIVSENKAFPHSHPFYVFLHFTHPPLLERLKALDYEIE